MVLLGAQFISICFFVRPVCENPRTVTKLGFLSTRFYQTKRLRQLLTYETVTVNCSVKSNPKSNKIQQYFHQPEVWAILILFGFQEVPFLLSRIYFITILKMVKSQMMVFFIAKNVLTIIVFGYRKSYELISIY